MNWQTVGVLFANEMRMLLRDRRTIIVAIILPPLAVLFCGKPVQFLLNIILTLLFWVPGVVHAILVVHDRNAEKRTRRVIRAVQASKTASA